MAYRSEILLGRITRASGYEGAVAIKLEKKFYENLPEMESVFLEIEGKPVPFFVSDMEYQGGGILKLMFEDYDSAEKVSEFKDCRVFLTEQPSDIEDVPGTFSFTDFRLYSDNEKNLIGHITEVIENPGQLLINVRTSDNKEILIPFHDDLIKKIDKKKKIIVMDLPEGLIDLN